jgi:hypothetical protein
MFGNSTEVDICVSKQFLCLETEQSRWVKSLAHRELLDLYTKARNLHNENKDGNFKYNAPLACRTPSVRRRK